MVVIHVTAKVKDERQQQFETSLSEIVRSARALPGCTRYEWYRAGEAADAYVIYGEFDSRADFDAYRASPVVRHIGSELLPLLQTKPTFKHFEAEVFEQG